MSQPTGSSFTGVLPLDWRNVIPQLTLSTLTDPGGSFSMLSTPIWMYSMEKNRMVWANRAALDICRHSCGIQSLPELGAFVLRDGTQRHMKTIKMAIEEKIKVQGLLGNRVDDVWYLPSNRPTVDFRLKLSGSMRLVSFVRFPETSPASRRVSVAAPTHSVTFQNNGSGGNSSQAGADLASWRSSHHGAGSPVVSTPTVSEHERDIAILIEGSFETHAKVAEVMSQFAQIHAEIPYSEAAQDEVLKSQNPIYNPMFVLKDSVACPVAIFQMSNAELIDSNVAFRRSFVGHLTTNDVDPSFKSFYDIVKDTSMLRILWRRIKTVFECDTGNVAEATLPELFCVEGADDTGANRSEDKLHARRRKFWFEGTCRLMCRCKPEPETSVLAHSFKKGTGVSPPILRNQRRHENDLVVITFRDVSDRHAALEDARKVNELLRICNHELRSPLMAIRLIVAMLLTETELTEFQKEHLLLMEYNTEANLRLVNSMLVSARAESGKLVLENSNFPLRDVVKKSCLTVAKANIEKSDRVTLNFVIDDAVPEIVFGDSIKVRELVINVTMNAYKFTNVGSIDVHVSVASRSPHSNQIVLKFEVRDTGCGIDPQDREKLFVESWVQFSQRDHEFGSGLGLHISKMLVELMEGEIGVRDNPFAPVSGSVFWFTIKVQTPQYMEPSVSKASRVRPRSMSFAGRPGCLLLPRRSSTAAELGFAAVAEPTQPAAMMERDKPAAFDWSVDDTQHLTSGNDVIGATKTVRLENGFNTPIAVDVSSGTSAVMAMSTTSPATAAGVVDSKGSLPSTGTRNSSGHSSILSWMSRFPVSHIELDVPPDFQHNRRRSCFPRIPMMSWKAVPAHVRLNVPADHAEDGKNVVKGQRSSSGAGVPNPGPGSGSHAAKQIVLQELPHLRIVFVDDDPIVRTLWKRKLEKGGHIVEVFDSAQKATKVLQSTPFDDPLFDVVVTDLMMPAVDGFDFAKSIRALDHPHSQVLIFGCTASSDPADHMQCLASGMDGVLEKSSRLTDFEELFLKVIRGGSPAIPMRSVSNARSYRAASAAKASLSSFQHTIDRSIRAHHIQSLSSETR
eukprot:ANDGO_05785.mRNA.1 Signal transduction histidine-protein kinase BarA